MKHNKTVWMTALALGGLVLLSNGVLAQDAKPAATRPRPNAAGVGGPGAAGAQDRMTKMADELKLSDEQKTKWQEAMKGQMEKMRAIRENSDLTPEQKREKMQAMRTEQETKMKEILTPEQQEKWQKQRDQMREKMQQGQGRPGRPEGAPPAGNPPAKPENKEVPKETK